jgi:non-heme chloroperoxidase
MSNAKERPKPLQRLTVCLVFNTLLFTVLYAQQPSKPETAQYKVQFVSVEPDVKLEVLDWGGSGRPLVFLSGLGLDAREFETFAPKFSPTYHVYAISRRGFGASSAPIPTKDNYSADRLGDDVLAVLDALKITRPVLVGHSIAGEELSSVASRYPEKVSGLIYLEAGYSHALYSPALGDMIIDAKDVQHQLDLLFAATLQTPSDFASAEESVARFDLDLEALNKRLSLQPPPPPRPANAPPPPPILLAIVNGTQKYTAIHVPVLAIYRNSQSQTETSSAQADAFQAAIPQARVVRMDHADHFIFKSNESQVIDEMNAFLANLPR